LFCVLSTFYEVVEKFQNKKKGLNKFARLIGSSSSRETRSSSRMESVRPAYGDYVFNLPRPANVKAAKWQCDAFMQETGIK
jgi:hypothetical protein